MGLLTGAGVAGAGRWAGMLDAASGGGSDLMDGVSTGLSSSLCGGGSDLMDGGSTGLSSSLCGGLGRVNGGLPGAGG